MGLKVLNSIFNMGFYCINIRINCFVFWGFAPKNRIFRCCYATSKNTIKGFSLDYSKNTLKCFNLDYSKIR